jgi:hypothetical protein
MRWWVVACTLMVGTGTAVAEPVPAAPEQSIGVAASLALGSPRGNLGLSAEGTLFSHLRLETGIGLDASGVQFGGGVSLTAGGVDQVGIGVGAALGRYLFREKPGVTCEDFCGERLWERAYWLVTDVSYRRGLGGGWQAGAFLGLSFLLNPDAGYCPPAAEDCAEPGEGDRRFFGGLMVSRRVY